MSIPAHTIRTGMEFDAEDEFLTVDAVPMSAWSQGQETIVNGAHGFLWPFFWLMLHR